MADGRLVCNITEEDVEVSIRCLTALPELEDVKPSEIASPLIWALLRATDGFPLCAYEDVVIARDPVADTLRSIYARFRSGESTGEQWFNAALPLLLQLRSKRRSTRLPSPAVGCRLRSRPYRQLSECGFRSAATQCNTSPLDAAPVPILAQTDASRVQLAAAIAEFLESIDEDKIRAHMTLYGFDYRTPAETLSRLNLFGEMDCAFRVHVPP